MRTTYSTAFLVSLVNTAFVKARAASAHVQSRGLAVLVRAVTTAITTRAVPPISALNDRCRPSRKSCTEIVSKQTISVPRSWCRVPACAVGFMLFSSNAIAQPWITYDASLGTLPSQQCFERNAGMLGVNYFILEVTGGALHQSTIGPPTGEPTDLYALHWWRTDAALNFADGFVMEMVALPISVGENFVAGRMRTGLNFNAVDDAGRWIVVWFRNGGISLTNHVHAPMTGAVVSAAAPADGEYHVYRVRADAAGAHLDIDGSNILNLPLGAPNQASRIVEFGDGSLWRGASSEVYIRSFQFSGVGAGPITMVIGPDSTSTCPSVPATFFVTPVGTAPFTYRWQWTAPAINPAWSDIAEGINTDPAGQPVFTAANAASPSVSVQRDPDTPYTYSDFTGFALRAVVTNDCGSATSDEATWTICPPDFNCDGALDSNDFFAFLDAFFGGDADFNGDGVTTSDDFFDFLGAYFAGCA